jgi:hypothetical protein
MALCRFCVIANGRCGPISTKPNGAFGGLNIGFGAPAPFASVIYAAHFVASREDGHSSVFICKYGPIELPVSSTTMIVP